MIRSAINHSKGPLWIKHYLRTKGVFSDIEASIERLYPPTLRREKIEALLGKTKKDRNKTIAAIIRKGFNMEEIISILNN